MSTDVVIPLISLIAGSLLTFGLESVRHGRARGEEVQDARRLERSKAYIDYLDAAHEAGHLLGRSARGCPNPLDDTRETYWLVDSRVGKQLRAVEVLGSDEVVLRARGLRASLTAFRAALREQDPVYESEEYFVVYGPVVRARTDLIDALRSDLRVL